mmetsp:Transcript_20749/g.18172  ORF Transcript_20749/g.18172 Transcript_20749/m.18172 type:complete len:102 (-) Transcript_20749:445-750(-)
MRKWVKYSHLEDLKLAKYVKVYGNDWAKISLHFINRDAMMLKNRYYAHVRKDEKFVALLKEVETLEAKYNCSLDKMNCSTKGVVSGPGEAVSMDESDKCSQ